jgi:DNA-binding LacI/PurR family transcriptional regulator
MHSYSPVIYFGSMSDVRDEQRYAGYCQAMENAGLPTGRIAPNKVSSVSIGTGMMNLARQMYAAMDGILCTNDDLAVGVLQECLASGIAVPAGTGDSGFSRSGDWSDSHPAAGKRSDPVL